MVIVQELWPDSKAPGYWREIGRAKDIEGAERIARRHYDPEGFGGFRHPDGGPKYGTIRAILEEGDGEWKILVYDGNGYFI